VRNLEFQRSRGGDLAAYILREGCLEDTTGSQEGESVKLGPTMTVPLSGARSWILKNHVSSQDGLSRPVVDNSAKTAGGRIVDAVTDRSVARYR